MKTKSKWKSALCAFKSWMQALLFALRGPLQARRLCRDVRVFEAGARVKENDFVFGLQVAGSKKMVVGDGRGRALRRKEDSFVFRPILERRENLLIRKGKSYAFGFFQNLEHDVVSVRFRHAQAGGERFCVLPHLADLFAGFEGASNGSATRRLHGYHARTFPGLYPAKVLKFDERLPHTDQPNAAA